MSPDVPPADPEEWTDEQWLDWLKETDTEVDTPKDAGDRSMPVTTRLANSSGGQVLGNAMMGLAQAIYGRQDDEIVIMAEGNSDPLDNEPITVHLDAEHPEQSTATFRLARESENR